MFWKARNVHARCTLRSRTASFAAAAAAARLAWGLVSVVGPPLACAAPPAAVRRCAPVLRRAPVGFQAVRETCSACLRCPGWAQQLQHAAAQGTAAARRWRRCLPRRERPWRGRQLSVRAPAACTRRSCTRTCVLCASASAKAHLTVRRPFLPMRSSASWRQRTRRVARACGAAAGQHGRGGARVVCGRRRALRRGRAEGVRVSGGDDAGAGACQPASAISLPARRGAL